MAYDFAKIKKLGIGSPESARRELTYCQNQVVVGWVLCKEDTLVLLNHVKTDIQFDESKLFLIVAAGIDDVYLLPDAPDGVTFPPFITKSAQEIIGTQWQSITKRIKSNLDPSSCSNQAKFAVRILSMNPYRPKSAISKLFYDKNAHVSSEELKIIEEVIDEVNTKELPDILQEQNCKTFGDLYATLEELSVVEIGKVDTPDLLGAYGYGKPTIHLYIDRLRDHSQGSLQVLKRLVRTTYIHELFHAYFNIFDNTELDKCNIKEIEEPLVEYVMLLTMKERYSRYYYNMAKKNVQQKKDSAYCYAIGSSSELAPEVLRAYKFQKFLLDEQSDKVKQYKSAVKEKMGLDVCAEELKTLILQ